MPEAARFLFVTCQVPAAEAVKCELAERWPDFRFAFSRPGFLTFKLPDNHRLPADLELGSVFARAHGFCVGKVGGTTLAELAAAAWSLFGSRPARRLHVWQRDRHEPGFHGFLPQINVEAVAAHAELLAACPHRNTLAADAADPFALAEPGEFVFDCVLVDPEQWWIGFHQAGSGPSQWPGGMLNLTLPEGAVSRAWLKMEEALRWSQLPIAQGARIAEIGSAPGGASQALLARGLVVTGIDPAEMDPSVLANPNFTHIRRRSTQVRRREFRKIRWLAADMNVAPNYTLDAVEGIVSHPEVNIRGLILTLKLMEWELAYQVPQNLDRIRSWGFNIVRARQLQHNRSEICVAALKKPFVRKTELH